MQSRAARGVLDDGADGLAGGVGVSTGFSTGSLPNGSKSMVSNQHRSAHLTRESPVQRHFSASVSTDRNRSVHRSSPPSPTVNVQARGVFAPSGEPPLLPLQRGRTRRPIWQLLRNAAGQVGRADHGAGCDVRDRRIHRHDDGRPQQTDRVLPRGGGSVDVRAQTSTAELTSEFSLPGALRSDCQIGDGGLSDRRTSGRSPKPTPRSRPGCGR